MIGMTEIMIVCAVAVFLFGGPKVVSWAKSLGQAKREFEKASIVEDKKEMTNDKQKISNQWIFYYFIFSYGDNRTYRWIHIFFLDLDLI